MEDLILWVTNGVDVLTPRTIVALFVLTVILESISVAIGHMASLGRS